MKIKLNKPFAANSAVDEFDVRQMKKALNRLSYYQPYEKTGITGIPDAELFAALKAFQKDQGLYPAGSAKPDDETVRALSREVLKTPDGHYVWRTVGDDRVRAGHAAHDWETRAWDDAPDPGEEFNCRCWAVPAKPEQIEKKKKQKCFDALSWEKEAQDNIEEHEGNKPHPYIDTAFKITIGIGSNIDSKAEFMRLPWKLGENGPDATKRDIEAAYEELTRQKSVPGNIKTVKKNGQEKEVFNKKAEDQERWTSLWLSEQERKKLFNEDFNAFRGKLPGKFSDFDCFPPKAKVALMDMIFNLGETKFSRGNWPNLFKAVNQRDWRTGAAQSHRLGVSEKRNGHTRGQFLSAAEKEEQSQQ